MKINYGIWECPSFGQNQYMQKIHRLPFATVACYMIPMIGQPHESMTCHESPQFDYSNERDPVLADPTDRLQFFSMTSSACESISNWVDVNQGFSGQLQERT